MQDLVAEDTVQSRRVPVGAEGLIYVTASPGLGTTQSHSALNCQ